MLKKISRKNFIKKYPDFIQSNPYKNKYVIPDTVDSYILYVDAKSTVSLCNNLSKELTKLLTLLNFENIFFLGDSTIPWLIRDHDYRPVKQGLQYLIDNKISKSFNGAIEVSIEEFPVFMKHLFWLVRCNGIFIYAHFSDPDFNIMGSICQYGNVHFSTLNEKTDIAFNGFLNQIGLHISEDNNCGGGKILGRNI